MGLMPSASVGEQNSLYEPIHGSFPEATGKNIANPLATILSAAMMLEMSFNLKLESDLIRKSVEKSIDEGYVTQDLSNGSYITPHLKLEIKFVITLNQVKL